MGAGVGGNTIDTTGTLSKSHLPVVWPKPLPLYTVTEKVFTRKKEGKKKRLTRKKECNYES